MNLIEKFAERIDSDQGYDNLSLAKDLAKISDDHHSEQCIIDGVSDCTIRDWIITYADSDGTIQKAVVSGKNDDEAIANFQSEYHQEWRTIKAVV